MGISTTQSTREHSSVSQSTTKQQQQELDVEHVLTQLTLEEKISLTAGKLTLENTTIVCVNKM